MRQSYLTSETYGIGELISQRKRFRVPRHQRDYAWSLEEVETYIVDIQEALEREADDYFVGLIVLHGPHGGVWEILDGQQRLATSTMLFSAIRQWLKEAGFDSDAEQIDQEFIALRLLGQSPIARLELNTSDRSTFQRLVLVTASNREIEKFASEAHHHSSQRRLAEATLACRMKVGEWAEHGGRRKEEQVGRLYSLAAYLETNVKAVCLEVGSAADAYVIFESLNYRGHDLSVLDLVKNHIYSLATPENEEVLDSNWKLMLESIQERDADDFLKVFWTSQYGRVQRGKLFDQVKERYTGPAGVLRLSKDLARAADPYIALEEPNHEIWANYPEACKHYVAVLLRLRSRQVRPVMLSALNAGLDQNELTQLLRLLLTLTIRYQTVGRRRTGALEIHCAKIASSISKGGVGSAAEVAALLSGVMPSDNDFSIDFLRYSEGTNRRALYMLIALEVGIERGLYDSSAVEELLEKASKATVWHILPKRPGDEWEAVLKRDPDFHSETLDRLGNRLLIESNLAHRLGIKPAYSEICTLANESEFALTRQLAERWPTWNRESLLERQNELAGIAVGVWRLPE